jgi:sigma-B regulation protein RsbU (phosphoserine phosphatase)
LNIPSLTGLLQNTKYRTILISAALFLTFDIGVLLPNVVISSRLKSKALSINLAGRQRMLSQRMTKAILQMQVAQNAKTSIIPSQKELILAYQLFDDTLKGFEIGKTVTGSDGKPVFLAAITTAKGKALIQQAQEIWQPYKSKIQGILADGQAVSPDKLRVAVTYAVEHNLLLLDLMNQLTTEQQAVADQEASVLQIIQFTGLVLALINFLILLSHSLRKLKDSDEQIEKAHTQIVALNESLKDENLRMRAELEITKRLQQMILPKEQELAEITDLDIASYMQPVTEVGGDYYDVIHQNGQVKIGIGDVTGHGLESGVLMIMVQTAVRALQENNVTEPKQFLDTLNRTIYHNVQRMKSHRNLTLSLLDYQDGRLRVSGQHEEMIIVRANGELERIDTIDLGFPIGLEKDIIPFVAHTDVRLFPGDVVVLYTDGITEAADINGVQYGLERLCTVVSNHRNASAKEIREAVINDLEQYIGEQEVFDDITLLIFKQK